MMEERRLTAEERGRIWLRLAIRGGLLVAVVAGCIWALPPLFTLFAPFVFALMVAALMNPLIRYLQRKLGWGRGVFTLLVLTLLVTLLGSGLFALGYVLVGELVTLGNNWEAILSQSIQVVERMEELLDIFWGHIPPVLLAAVDMLYENVLGWLQVAAPQWMELVANGVGELVTRVPSFLLALLIFVLATYFLAADYPYLRTSVMGWMNQGLVQFLGDVRQTALAAFGGYLRAQLLLSVGVFFILLTGFFFVGQPYGMVLAVGLAILDFIPILGAGTVMVPWAFVALFSGSLEEGVELMAIWGLVALFRRVAEPKFVGNQTGLSPVLSLMSIYVGMQVAGVLGMVLGPIVVLVVLNLGTLGVFRGLVTDCARATWDVIEFLKRP